MGRAPGPTLARNLMNATSPSWALASLLLVGLCSSSFLQKRDPYPGEAYRGNQSHWLSVSQKPTFVAEVDAWLAQAERPKGPETHSWRTNTYRALLAKALDADSTLPEHWVFDEIAEALVASVPITHADLKDAILDLVYGATGEDWDLNQRRNQEIMRHVEDWCGWIDPDSPYWLALQDLRAGLHATLGNKREALESFQRIDAHLDEEREAQRSPLFMNAYAMTRANVWRDIGRDVEALKIIDEALVWLDRFPIEPPFGAYIRYFTEERRLQVLKALEQFSEVERQLEISLQRHAQAAPGFEADIDVLTEIQTVQAEWWLHEWLEARRKGQAQPELVRRIDENIAIIDGVLAAPEELMRRTYDTELETRWRFGAPLFEIEWWLHGPERALRRLHEGEILRFFQEETGSPDTWFRSQATVMGHWGTVAVEAGASAEEQARALAHVRANLPHVVESLRSLPHFADGYDPNYRSGLRPLVEALIVHALHGAPGAVEWPEVVAAILEQGRAGSIAKRMDAPGGTLAEVQRALCPPGTGILHFQPGYRNHYWLLIDRDGVTVRPLGRPHEYRALQSRLYGSSQLAQVSARTDRLDRDLQAFAAWVFEDDLLAECRRRGWSTLLTSGIAGHYYVPFDLLPNEQGHPIGSEFRIAHLPSLTVGLALHDLDRQRPTPATTRFLSVLVPEIDPTQASERWISPPFAQPAPLERPAVQALLDAIATGWHADLWIGPEQATLDRLVARLQTPFEVLHVFGHGSRARDLLGTPGVLLYDSQGAVDLWTHKRIEGMRAPWINLLTACSTTDVEPRSGDDGGHHLAGALLAQGSNTVICSALPVEYHESRALDDAFLRFLGEGHTTAEALFRARQSLGGADGPPGLYLVHAFGLGTAAVPPGDPARGHKPEVSEFELLNEPQPVWPFAAGGLLLAGAAGWLLLRRRAVA